MDNLSSRATLVSLNCSNWTGRCTDKDISQNIIIQHNADEHAGSFSKRLIDKNYLKPINEIFSEARKYYKENTLAWEEGKNRLLPSKKIKEFEDKMREYQVKLSYAVEEFVKHYDTYKQEAQTMLNGMYNEGDYPSSLEIKDKFQLKFFFDNISDPEDFRCEVSQELKDKIQNNIKQKTEEQYKYGLKRLTERIFNVISHFNEKINEYNDNNNKRLYSSTLGNIEELVDILPDLNFMNEPAITEVIDSIQNEICRFDINQLKNDESARAQAVESSNKILKELEGIY